MELVVARFYTPWQHIPQYCFIPIYNLHACVYAVVDFKYIASKSNRYIFRNINVIGFLILNNISHHYYM